MPPISVILEIDISSPAMASTISSFTSPAAGIPGVRIDPTFAPVPAAHDVPSFSHLAPSRTVFMRADADDVESADLAAQQTGVVAVWSDPEIAPFNRVDLDVGAALATPAAPTAPNCAVSTPTGTAAQVAEALGAHRVWTDGFRGQGIIIGVLDGGVDGSRYPVDGGWSPPGQSPPGSPIVAWSGHGSMCAFDAMIAAPSARIFDYGIGKTAGVTTLLSAALQSFQHALDHFRVHGTPQVLTNSWGLYQDAWDPFPHPDPRNYSHNPRHPFTRKVIEAIDAGLLVTFAAGNCGAHCPDNRCWQDVGPGRSIRGANGHERAITVAGVDLQRRRVGYSSQGPSTLDPRKPDISGYTHFTGHTQCDAGTSAACPVVAGGLALLRSAISMLRQDRARSTMARTAINLGPPGWDADTGHGVINVAAMYDELRQFPSPPGT
jgi:subtilisin family serine protease